MLSEPSDLSILATSELFRFINLKKSVNEVIEDLLLVIQNIVAGTVKVFNNILSDCLLEFQICLPASFLTIKIQYVLDHNFKIAPMDCEGIKNNFGKDIITKYTNLEIIHDLLLVTHSIIAGTGIFSVLSECPLQCKISLPTSSLIVFVQHELVSVYNFELVQNDSLLDYKELESHMDTELIKISECNKGNVKQEIPELLAVLNDSGAISKKKENLEKNQVKMNFSQQNIHSMSKTNIVSNPNSNVLNSSETELIEITPDLNVLTDEVIEFSGNCENVPLNQNDKKRTESIKIKSHQEAKRIFKTTENENVKANEMVVCTQEENDNSNQLRKPYSCDYCKKKFRARWNLEHHKLIHAGEKLSKNQCQNSFRETLRLHLLLMINKEEKRYLCKHCGKMFCEKEDCEYHEMLHEEVKRYSCRYCGERFREKWRLQPHEMTHVGEKPHKCNECGKSFHEKRCLQKHELTHREKKRYSCDTCEKTFCARQNLHNHEKIHTGEKPYKCNFCGKLFRQKWNCQQHEIIHSGEKSLHCDYCGKSFSCKGNLHRHQKLHAEEKHCKKSLFDDMLQKQKKLYSCSYCKKSFWTKERRQTHEKIHTGENPLGCKDCGKSFTHLAYLHKHQMEHIKGTL